MSNREYLSTDASAPVITGQIGGFLPALRAILVTGYGSVPGAGWTEVFTGTNVAVFRAPSGNMRYLRVDDSAILEMRLVGYESMSDVNTGTDPFPTAGQVSGGLFCRKSAGSDATQRPWIAYASDTAFYFFIFANSTSLGATTSGDAFLAFGDFTSYFPGDAFNSFIIAAGATGATASRGAQKGNPTAATFITSMAGHYTPRLYTQIGAAARFAKTNRDLLGASSTVLSGPASSGSYPDPIIGGLLMSPLEVWEEPTTGVFVRRGKLPGLWAAHHNSPIAHTDTFSGTGALSGKSFRALTCYNSTSVGQMIVERTSPWG